METVEQVNHDVIELWRRQFIGDKNVRMPLVYPTLNKKAELLFVGLNPSFGKHWPHLKESEIKDIDPEQAFLWENFVQGNRFNADLKTAAKEQELAKAKHRYFSLYRDIARDLEVRWEHVDLFFYRQTDQTDLKAVISDDDTFRHLNDFGRRQLELSKQLICYFQPKVIVVANSAAGEIFESEFEVTFNKAQDRYLTRLNGTSVPTFLTPITRWMNKEARSQLERDIKKILKGQ